MKKDITQVTIMAERKLSQIRDVFVEKLATKAVELSERFVDTGSYINSHSITTALGTGRSISSHDKPKKQSPNAMKTQALTQVKIDATNIPSSALVVYVTNRAPHAKKVEVDHGYGVYAVVRNLASNLLQQSIAEMRSRQ